MKIKAKQILTDWKDPFHFIYGFGAAAFTRISFTFRVIAIVGYIIFFLYQQFEKEPKRESIYDMVEFFSGYVLGDICFK